MTRKSEVTKKSEVTETNEETTMNEETKASTLDQLKNERAEAETTVRNLRTSKKKLEKELRKIDAQLKYSPDNEDLTIERESVIASLADMEMKHDEAVQDLHNADTRLRNAQIQHERDRLVTESQGYENEFNVPNEYPVLACQMISAIADNLQYRFCSTQGYYEWLTGQIYGRSPGDENRPDSSQDDPNPEINLDQINRLEELHAEREYIIKLRFAIERVFDRYAEQIPADSSFRPQLLRRNDRQVLEDIERRREQQFENKRQQNQAAREAAKDFSRHDLDIYKRGVQ